MLSHRNEVYCNQGTAVVSRYFSVNLGHSLTRRERYESDSQASPFPSASRPLGSPGVFSKTCWAYS